MKNLSKVIIIDNDLNEVNDLNKTFVSDGIVPCLIEVSENSITQSIPDFKPYIVFSDIKVLPEILPNVAQFDRIANILIEIIPDNHPYVFVSFSGTGLEHDLEEHLKQNLPETKQPIQYVTNISKNDSIEEINKKIKPSIDKTIYALLTWRKLIADSAENTFLHLWNLSKQTQLNSVLKGLAIQSIGEKHLAGNEPRAILEQMHALLMDTCNKNIITDEQNIRIFKDALEAAPDLDGDNSIKSILNSILITDQSINSTKNIFPGDVRMVKQTTFKNMLQKYIPGIANKKNTLLKLLTDEKKHKEMLFYSYFEKDYLLEEKQIKNTIQLLKQDANATTVQKIDEKLSELKQTRDFRNDAIKQVIKKSTFAILDITAGCDFAQKKEGLHKIVLAYLVPKQKALNVKKRLPASVIVKEIYLNNKEYFLIIDSKYLTGINERDIRKISTHTFRIREASLNQIRQSVLFYNARIGTSTF